MITRHSDIDIISLALRRSRVVALLGPRQCGKTTLARRFVPQNSINYFDSKIPQSCGLVSRKLPFGRSRLRQ